MATLSSALIRFHRCDNKQELLLLEQLTAEEESEGIMGNKTSQAEERAETFCSSNSRNNHRRREDGGRTRERERASVWLTLTLGGDEVI